MKCVRNISDGRVVRVKDDEAQEAVATGKWAYTCKREWKETGRKTLRR